MLDIKLLNKIKPGDEVIYEDYFSDIKSEVHGIVEEIAVRRGRDENGNIYSDDCIYVDDGSIYGAHEVCYADIKDIKFKEVE